MTRKYERTPFTRAALGLEKTNLREDGGGGRSSTLTPAIHEAVIEGIKNGNYISTVMQSVGVPLQNFYHWKRQGSPKKIFDDEGNEVGEEYPDNFYGDFMRDYDEALSYAEIRAVKALQSHFDKDWRAAAEFLARKFPERWNPKSVVEHQGKDGGPIMTEDRREVLYAKLDMISSESTVDVVGVEGETPDELDSGKES